MSCLSWRPTVGTAALSISVLAFLGTGCSSSLTAPSERVAKPGEAPVPPTQQPEDPGITDDSEDDVQDPQDPPEEPEEETEDDPVEDPDPPQDPDPPEDPDPPQDPDPPTAQSDQACYPGADLSWTTCFPLVDASGLGSAYAYPAALNGSPQYRQPEHFLDLNAHAGDTMLAPNFRLDEVAQSWKGQFAIVQPHAIDRLQDLRDDLGALVVNSGYRPPDYNASVGGATYSRHMYGDAFDLDPVSVSLTTLQNTCYSHGAGYVGVYSTHIHCDWRDDSVSVEFFGSNTSSFAFDMPILDGFIRSDVDLSAIGTDASSDAVVLDAPATGWDEGEPLREWTAYDVDGYAIDFYVGETYEPPLDAASVEVFIGREVLRTISL